MFILLQKPEKENPLKIEYAILKDILDRNKYTYEYMPTELNDFYFDGKLGTPQNYPKYWATAIPIGTLNFVESWMSIFHNKLLNPIEIPKCLRTEEFLKRKYKIVNFEEIPKSGKWFVKDVSKLKTFTSALYEDISQLDLDKYSKPNEGGFTQLDNSHLFQVSEKLTIYSEYRVYIIDGKIENVAQYNGDMFHYPDMQLINKANLLYSMQQDYPKSYTIDVMVTERGTALIEIHPFTAIGLYATLWSDKLPYAYMDGIDYYINHNTLIERD